MSDYQDTDKLNAELSELLGEAPPAKAPCPLNKSQERALDYVLAGKNIFLTGAGGTGKSFTLKYIIDCLPRLTTFVTALTGMAALHIGGTTIHKFSGIRLGNGTVAELMRYMSRQAKMNWRLCTHLIIDEISMMSGEMFDKLEEIARKMKGNNKPFGGIQLILCGDFFQCPPVNKKFKKTDPDVPQCFEAESWGRCVDIEYELRNVERQKEDLALQFLTALRESDTNEKGVVQLEQKWIDLLDYLERPLKARKDGILPTKLFCTNDDVDYANARELKKLDGDQHTFDAVDTGDDDWRKEIEKHCIAPFTLDLKVGAQVALTKNSLTNNKLVNGSRGIVVRFDTPADGNYGESAPSDCKAPLPVVRFKCGAEETIRYETWSIEDRQGKVLASRTQVALKLAWNQTCHRAQGSTIEYLEVNIADAFDYGIAYVALSRFTTLTGLRVVAYNLQQIRNDPRVKAFTKKMRARPENQPIAA